MGGAVSSGRTNNELVDNLMEGNYIRSPDVERVFRSLDRADYMTPDTRDQAYKDLAWRNGPLHLSSPCIYSEVMEGLELKSGQSFLNIGSGTGYLSTMAGLVVGSGGINHGVEVNQMVVEYATTKNKQFIENSATIDDFDFCEPKYYLGNGLCLAPLPAPYDRVYCGAGCPEQYTNYFKQLIRVGGILVMPSNDTLLQVKRLGESEWVSRSLLNVSFAPLKLPTSENPPELIKLDEQTPTSLQLLARGSIRRTMRLAVLFRNPELQEPPLVPFASKAARPQRHTRRCPRRICIPIDERPGNFNMIHDLDRENGANEMNALLSLVLSMGENRVAGALRYDSPYESSTDEESNDDEPDDETGNPEPAAHAASDDPESPERRIDVVFRSFLSDRNNRSHDNDATPTRSLTFEFHEAESRASRATASNSGPPNPKQCTSTNSEVPADVQVYLDNTAIPGTSKTEGKREPTSDDDTESITKGNDEKRQKLDSGIGEENSPSSSSPDKTEKCVESEDTYQFGAIDTVYRARLGKAKRGRVRALSSSSEDESSEPGPEFRRRKRRAGRLTGDARLVRLSILSKRAVRELPLPYVLKKYVNLGRCFEF